MKGINYAPALYMSSGIRADDLRAIQKIAARKPPGKRLPWVRSAIQAFGHVNPVGDGNGKTATASTYRPVGPTCPQSCPYLKPVARTGKPPCLALAGFFVRRQQGRARTDVGSALRAAAVAMVIASLDGDGMAARGRVSGDYGQTWADARVFINGLMGIAQILRERGSFSSRWVGLMWGYTHLPRTPEGLAMVAAMEEVGIYTRWSDYAGPMGTVVAEFTEETRERLRSVGAKPFFCLEQVDPANSNCRSCRVCWERPKVTVVFKPSGGRYVAEMAQRGKDASQ